MDDERDAVRRVIATLDRRPLDGKPRRGPIHWAFVRPDDRPNQRAEIRCTRGGFGFDEVAPDKRMGGCQCVQPAGQFRHHLFLGRGALSSEPDQALDHLELVIDAVAHFFGEHLLLVQCTPALVHLLQGRVECRSRSWS